LESGRPVVLVAEEIGVEQSVLYKWKKKYEHEILSLPDQSKGKTVTRKEVAMIQKEIIELKESMSILKSVLRKTLTNICDF